MTYTLDWQAYTKLARQTVAEGAVLLHNDGVLPLQPASTVAVFGRNQFNYYKSGTGFRRNGQRYERRQSARYATRRRDAECRRPQGVRDMA